METFEGEEFRGFVKIFSQAVFRYTVQRTACDGLQVPVTIYVTKLDFSHCISLLFPSPYPNI